MSQISEIIYDIQSLVTKKLSVIVGIDGRGGSGKSTLAKYLQSEIPNTKILCADDFLHNTLLKPEIKRLKQEVLIPFACGKVATYRKFDWNSGELLEPQNIQPKGILIVEGVYALSQEIVDLFDYKIWVEYPADLALARGITRDREEYNIVEPEEYWDQWVNKEKEYIVHESPQNKADCIVDGSQPLK